MVAVHTVCYDLLMQSWAVRHPSKKFLLRADEGHICAIVRLTAKIYVAATITRVTMLMMREVSKSL